MIYVIFESGAANGEQRLFAKEITPKCWCFTVIIAVGC